MRWWEGLGMQLPYNQDNGMWYYQTTKTITTNTTNVPGTETLGEEQVRRIVREEIADIVAIDVPDAPPEDL